jgi:hypothetical protein
MVARTEFEHSLFKIGGAAAIVGALLGLVANLLHPITPTDDPEGVAQLFAASGLWVPVHLGIIAGPVLIALDGLAAKQLAEAWATAPSGQRATAARRVLAGWPPA